MLSINIAIFNIEYYTYLIRGQRKLQNSRLSDYFLLQLIGIRY